MQLEEVLEDPLDVVERVRPVLVARQLDRAPDLLVGRLGLDPVELALAAARARPRAARRAGGRGRSACSTLPEPDLCVTRHLLVAIREQPQAAAPSVGRSSARGTIASTWPKRRFDSARPKSSGSFSRVVCATTRGPANDISAPGSASSTSPRLAKLASTPPVVGCAMTLISAQPASCSSSTAHDRLRQLHEREDPLLHARAAGGGDRDERDAGARPRSRRRARTSRPSTRAHRAAHEREVHDRELARAAARSSPLPITIASPRPVAISASASRSLYGAQVEEARADRPSAGRPPPPRTSPVGELRDPLARLAPGSGGRSAVQTRRRGLELVVAVVRAAAGARVRMLLRRRLGRRVLVLDGDVDPARPSAIA